ncbi:MAG: ATP-binding protein [bacterium]|nr:ATP-binding protein [bacterium]
MTSAHDQAGASQGARSPNEASTRAFSEYLRVLEHHGVDLEPLCEGLPVTLAQLRRTDGWIAWDTSCELLERIPRMLGGDEPWAVLAGAVVNRPKAWRMAQVAISPMQLYRLTASFTASRLWPIHRAEVEVNGPTRLRIELFLPEDVRGSEDFFFVAREIFRALPTALGLPHARVEAKTGTHHGEYDILVPDSMTLFARIKRRAALVLGEDPTTELLDHQRALHDSYDALSRAHADLEKRQRALLEEIEERRRTERALRERDEQLQQSQKLELVGKLASGIAHDFNNLLTVMSGCTELLSSSVNDADGRALLEDLRGTLEPSGRLIAQLLTFTAGRSVEPRRVSLRRALESQRSMLQRVTSGLDLELELQDELPCIFVAPSHLDQIVLNLVVNARDAIADEGTVRICARMADGMVALEVADDGVGMTDEVRSKVFHPFFTTKDANGTGLGLATVKNLVDECGGSIELHSTPGVGTRFVISFPPVEGPPDTLVGRESAGNVRARPGETVLLVDDDPILLRLLGTPLERAGFRTYTARGLVEAQRILDVLDRPLDLLITDINLRRRRGTRLAELARERFPKVVVVYISGAEGAPDDPGSHFIAKPFGPSRLLEFARAALDGGR